MSHDATMHRVIYCQKNDYPYRNHPFNSFFRELIHIKQKFPNVCRLFNTIFIMVLSSVLPTTTVYAALLTTTTKTIQGSAPSFVSTSGEHKFGFTVNGTFYSEQTSNIASDSTQLFSGDLTFNDFVVKKLTAADFTVEDDYEDIDGDIAHSVTPFNIGTTTYSWKDSSNTVIPESDYHKTIGCDGSYNMPLTLVISADNVFLQSQYGNPYAGAPATLTKTYDIAVNSAICYVKPRSSIEYSEAQWLGYDENGKFKWNDVANTSPREKHGGGYRVDYVPDRGFRASADTRFPVSGFPGAQFQLVMAGAPSDYIYSVPVNPNNSISVENEGQLTGMVTLDSKPSGPVTVRATLKSDSRVFYDYQFTVKLWVIPQPDAFWWDETAINQCGGINNIPTREELTNSPYNKAPQDWTFVPNAYTRAIGEGVFAEWGITGDSAYPKSQWAKGSDYYYWTADPHSDISQFVTFSSIGDIVYYNTSNGNRLVCKG